MPESSDPRPLSVPMTIIGVLFMLGWVGAHFVWGFLLLMGGVMANDSGAATEDQHAALLARLLGGACVAGAAGVPGGLAFFLRRKRKALVWTAVGLFVAGAALQVWGFLAFGKAAGG